MLGVALNLEQHQLKRIKYDNREAQECQNDMLYSWISTGNATWSGLVEALRSPLLDNQQLAQEIEVKYMKYVIVILLFFIVCMITYSYSTKSFLT